MTQASDTGVTVVIPTYGRDSILVETLGHLLRQTDDTNEVLVCDQNLQHDAATAETLRSWEESGRIRWIRLDTPSIPGSMNVGLREASYSIVLFVDDDIVPGPNLIAAHAAVYAESADIWAVAGQVLQPGEGPLDTAASCKERGLGAHLDFRFCSTSRGWVKNAIGCNFSVRRGRALEIGGFDENFVGVAYRFETEFCRRLCCAGGRIRFEPTASIRHLRTASGGTRAQGGHLRSASPIHGVGDYYFALTQGVSLETLAYMIRRPFREVCTRFHLGHPWWIPVKLIGEIRAFLWAIRLAARGPRYGAFP